MARQMLNRLCYYLLSHFSLSLPLSFSISLSLGFGTRNIGNAGGKFDTWAPRASNRREDSFLDYGARRGYD